MSLPILRAYLSNDIGSLQTAIGDQVNNLPRQDIALRLDNPLSELIFETCRFELEHKFILTPT